LTAGTRIGRQVKGSLFKPSPPACAIPASSACAASLSVRFGDLSTSSPQI